MGKDLGALPQTPLRGLLKAKSPKNLQDLQLICIFDSVLTWCRFWCSHIPCYYFRLLPHKIPSSGILSAYALLPLPDRNGRKLVINGIWGGMRGAPCGLRPCKVRNPLEIRGVGNDLCVVPFRMKEMIVDQSVNVSLSPAPNIEPLRGSGRATFRWGGLSG